MSESNETPRMHKALRGLVPWIAILLLLAGFGLVVGGAGTVFQQRQDPVSRAFRVCSDHPPPVDNCVIAESRKGWLRVSLPLFVTGFSLFASGVGFALKGRDR